MARRNPMNQRYTSDKSGSTKKSAASAKPKRSAGERSGTSSTKSKKDEKPEKKSRFIETVTTPEIKAHRKRWWIMMGLALLAAGALLLEPVQDNQLLVSIAIGTWLASFGSSVYLDLFVIRKLRKAEIERRKAETKGKKSGKKG
jgi:hypothetical protein